MSILVRNEDHLSECTLFHGGIMPKEEIINHPSVQKLVGGRRIQQAHMNPPLVADGLVIVDLVLSKPQ